MVVFLITTLSRFLIAMWTAWPDMPNLAAVVTGLVPNPDIIRDGFGSDCVDIHCIVLVIIGVVTVGARAGRNESRIDGGVSMSVPKPTLATAKINIFHFKIGEDIYKFLM